MKNRRNLILGAVALAVILIAVAILRSGSGALPVREATVQRGRFVVKLPETGVIEIPEIVSVPAGVGGNLKGIFVIGGQRVRAGELLATLDSPQIVSTLHDAQDSMTSANGHVASTSEQAAVLPSQNRSAVVQAQAAVVQARAQLGQARQDLIAGAQSGLGYGAQTAAEQKIAADATLSKAQTDLSEASRIYDADRDLFDQKAISRDQLDQSKARYDQALVTFRQAQSERRLLDPSLSREHQVLVDRVRAAEDALHQAQAQLTAAQAEARTSKEGDLASAQADAARAGADYSYAQDQFARLEVRSPLDGIVIGVASEPGDSLRPRQSGDPVQAGETLFSIARSRRFIVRTKVDEQDIAGVRVGQRAIVSGEDFAGRQLDGRVADISPAAVRSDDPSNTSRQILTTIALDRTLPFLRDGMSVDVDIVTSDEPSVLSVPLDALRRDAAGHAFIYIVRAGKAERADVTLGTQSDTAAVVKSGLHPGDIVVADRNPEVTANRAVRPGPSPSPASSGAPAGP